MRLPCPKTLALDTFIITTYHLLSYPRGVFGLFIFYTDSGNKFRLVDAQNFYFFWLTGDGRYTVGKVVTDHAIPIKQRTYSKAIRKRGENRMRVEFRGTLMNIFINGEKVTVLKDDTFTQGGYGFYTFKGVRACYDNGKVVSGSPFELHMPRTGNMESFRGMTEKTFSLNLKGNRNEKIGHNNKRTGKIPMPLT